MELLIWKIFLPLMKLVHSNDRELFNKVNMFIQLNEDAVSKICGLYIMCDVIYFCENFGLMFSHKT